ncbi:cation:proton antiporter [Marinicauda salina]|uniref:Cation:proton antiporter n=1 Tax=Marinicauda salina TaxID=2135793 RepID=A0A2U2BSM9_9PROT|nr:Na(+)/H(+) antiporter subunit B [Marinicauda salina]PWE16998.1 cation:proton antiporter [Marinicauda salina]
MNPHLVLRVVAQLLIPFIVVYGFYVHFHGEYSPGGGFQAGVILAAAVILYALIYGMDAAKRAIPPAVARVGMALGAMIYAGVGFATLLMGGEFLDYDVLHPDHAHHTGQHMGIILVEVGVLVTVTSVMLAIFYAFAGRTPDIPEEEW